MAYVANVYQGDHIAATDLGNIEGNFEYLRTNFLGAGAPADPGGGLEGVLWRDSNKDLLKVRGSAGWLGILALAAESTNGLIWFHGDNLSAQEGWAIDTSITEDRVMALKNHGAGTYTSGRAVAGTWQQPGHTLLDAEIPKHTHPVASSGAHRHSLYISSQANAGNPALRSDSMETASQSWNNSFTQSDGAHTHTAGEQATGDGSHDHGNAYRIRAQVGIVIYPDM